MTDTGNEERPLTRRELRALERAAAEAAQGASADVGEAEGEDTTAKQVPADPSEIEEGAAESAPETPEVDHPAAKEPVEELDDEALAAESPVAEPAAEASAPEGSPVDEPEPADAQDSSSEEGAAAPEAEEPAVTLAELAAEPASDAAAAEPGVEETASPEERRRQGLGRFFGRKTVAPETEPPADFDALIVGGPEAEPKDVADSEAVAAEVVEVEAVEAEADEPATADTPEVEGPARARGMKLDESRRQHLDPVEDADVDSLEIDEVEASETRVSAATVSGKTPAQLEDTRGESFEAEEEPSGPTRGRATRLPFVVNVVEDTSEHHISDLKRGGERIEDQNVGTGSSSITANALVLPATGQEDEIQFESEDGVLVTGSIDLPDGYASSGRARGKFDSAEIDSSSDGSEVSNPETAPVRASRAVSSYANARVSIAPKRQSRSALPWALGIGGGIVFAGVLVVVIGFTAGWF